ncbi:MAG TPA: hypothetical protein VHU42_13590 [Rhodopila sp.]|nr:hypothetical protein [Rhodopila sp.]
MRHVLSHWLAGSVGGVVGAVTLVATNTGSLRDLVWHTDGGWLAFALLILEFAFTFGSAAIGHGIISIGDKDAR